MNGRFDRSLTASALASLLIATCACHSSHDWYPPPAQFVMPSGPEPSSPRQTDERLMLYMSDDDAGPFITDNLAYTGDGYGRTLGLHPKFRLEVRDVTTFDAYVRLFNDEVAIRQRGPMSLTMRVDGKQLAPIRLNFPGDLEWRWHVADGWITKPGPVEITLDIDPPARTPDGVTWGILLHSIGLERRPK